MPVSFGPRRLLAVTPALAAGLGFGLACAGGEDECGPSEVEVVEVIDGDTIDVRAPGEDEVVRVRYLMIDTPESTGGDEECYGPEAKAENAALVAGETVTLRYDEECEDDYGRLLAYVELRSGRTVNEILVERGYACVLHIPPNGDDVAEHYAELESFARTQDKGLWGACEPPPC